MGWFWELNRGIDKSLIGLGGEKGELITCCHGKIQPHWKGGTDTTTIEEGEKACCRSGKNISLNTPQEWEKLLAGYQKGKKVQCSRKGGVR